MLYEVLSRAPPSHGTYTTDYGRTDLARFFLPVLPLFAFFSSLSFHAVLSAPASKSSFA
jgi:hypothetical protein